MRDLLFKDFKNGVRFTSEEAQKKWIFVDQCGYRSSINSVCRVEKTGDWPLMAQPRIVCRYGQSPARWRDEQNAKLPPAARPGHFLFLAKKESDQRKRPSPTEQTEGLWRYGDFPTRQSLARSENDAHPCASPSGSALGIGAHAWLKSENQSADAVQFRTLPPANSPTPIHEDPKK